VACTIGVLEGAERACPAVHQAHAAAAGGAGVRRGAAAACRAGALPAGTRGVWLGLGRIIALYHRCSSIRSRLACHRSSR
jgi:hypothetical protein